MGTSSSHSGPETDQACCPLGRSVTQAFRRVMVETKKVTIPPIVKASKTLTPRLIQPSQRLHYPATGSSQKPA